MGMAKPTKVLLVARAFILLNDQRIHLIRRTDGDWYDAGLWETAGGKVDPGELAEKGLTREIQQETGFTVTLIHPLLMLENYIIKEGPYAGWTYMGMCGVARRTGGTEKLSREHTASRRVTYNELLQQNLTKHTKKAAVFFKDILTAH